MHSLLISAASIGMANIRREQNERPSYPRVRAPVFFTHTVLRFLRRSRRIDPGLGGVRVYTDEETKVGSRLELEVFLPDGTSVACTTQVSWVEELPAGAAARRDVGLQILAIHPHDRERLSKVLEPT